MLTEVTYNKICQLLRECFNMNAEADNFAYNLGYHYYNEIEDLYHHSYAHIFPAWADQISDFLLSKNERPIRMPLDGFAENYDSLEGIFADNLRMIEKFQKLCYEAIDIADINGDVEAKIFLEDFVTNTVRLYVKQAYEWLEASKNVAADQMNFHIRQYTHSIPIV